MWTSPNDKPTARLAGKVAIVTGSGRGIGREIARRFLAEGARVVVADLDFASAQDTVTALGANAAGAFPLRVDIADPVSVDAMVSETLTRCGRLDVLVNNAGIGHNKPVLETTLAEWEQQLRVNLTGTFLCAQAAARVMLRQRAGRIINIASISGQRGGTGRAAYGAAKAGVIQLTRVMAVELAEHGIGVNAIAPGPVDTEQSRGTHTPATRRAYLERIPMKRYGESGEIAAAAVFLASDEASFVAGQTLNVDGGFDAAGLMFEQSD